jgi:hypothetical protein
MGLRLNSIEIVNLSCNKERNWIILKNELVTKDEEIKG